MTKFTGIGIAITALAASLLGACAGTPELDVGLDPRVIYEEAERSMKGGNYEQAVAIYEHLDVTYPFSDEARQARLDLIYAYYEADQPELTAEAAENFIRENPRDPNVDYAYYLRGLAFFERDRNILEKLFRVDLTERPPNDAERAFSYFQALVQRFPNSPYADDASDRMRYLRNRLASYEVHVASFYMDAGAWVAAINRAKFVVENYSEAPHTQEALIILVKAYDELGMQELADGSRAVLTDTYGNAAFKDDRRWWQLGKKSRPEPPTASAPTASTPSASN